MLHRGLSRPIAARRRSPRSVRLPTVLDLCLVVLLALPAPPSLTSLSVPHHALWRAHQARAVRRCAVSCVRQAHRPQRAWRDAPAATDRQAPPGICGEVTAAPSESGLTSDDSPDSLEIILIAEERDAPIRCVAACPAAVGVGLPHLGVGPSRAPPTVVA